MDWKIRSFDPPPEIRSELPEGSHDERRALQPLPRLAGGEGASAGRAALKNGALGFP